MPALKVVMLSKKPVLKLISHFNEHRAPMANS